jgi:hypothetical protein
LLTVEGLRRGGELSAEARLQLGHVGLDPAERLHDLADTNFEATVAVRSERKPIPTNISTIPISRP